MSSRSEEGALPQPTIDLIGSSSEKLPWYRHMFFLLPTRGTPECDTRWEMKRENTLEGSLVIYVLIYHLNTSTKYSDPISPLLTWNWKELIAHILGLNERSVTLVNTWLEDTVTQWCSSSTGCWRSEVVGNVSQPSCSPFSFLGSLNKATWWFVASSLRYHHPVMINQSIYREPCFSQL